MSYQGSMFCHISQPWIIALSKGVVGGRYDTDISHSLSG